MKLGIKIKNLREERGLTQMQLADLTGLSRASIQLYEANKVEIPLKKLADISNALNIDTSFFIEDNISQGKSQSDLIKLNYFPNISVSAGYGATNDNETKEVVEINQSFLAAVGLKVFKNLDLISVFGDSMEPFVSNGEMVIVERTSEARNDDVVIANINGEVYVKRLQRAPFGNVVKLVSTNPAYIDIELKDDELEYLKIVGVVRAKIRLF